MSKAKTSSVIPIERIARCVYVIRGQKVMLDSDLAALYGVTTSRLNEQVKRNLKRFPEDFSFPLNAQEYKSLRSQNATLNDAGRGKHRKYLPRVFTEHGILMLSSVLNSEQATQVNIAIMRTFVRLREMLATNEDLARKVARHDQEIATLFHHIQRLLEPPKTKKHPIGYVPAKDRD